MPKNQIDKEEINVRVLKIKNELYNGTYLGPLVNGTTVLITCSTRFWIFSKNIDIKF